MKLRFKPRGDAMPMVPLAAHAVGQPKRYIGRKLNPDSGEYELTGKSYECDEDSPEARRIIKLMRRDGDILPADAATAKACGVEFDEPAPVAESSKKGGK